MTDWVTSLTMGGPVGPKMPTKPWNGLAIIGEVPGVQEVAHGEPMTGPTGRIFDKILTAAGIERDATLITNVFRMLPIWTVDEEGRKRPNDTGVYFTDDPSKANDRLKTFRQRRILKGPDEDVRELWRLLRRERPRLIVACGAVALWALTGEDAIGQVVGTYLETACTDAKVLATWHPAYAKHKNDEDIAVKIATDMRAAADYVAAEAAAEAAA